MPSKKKWGLFLSVAVASSAAQAQSPAKDLTLSLDPPAISVVKSIIEENTVTITDDSLTSDKTKAPPRLQPARIERSVLQAPRIEAAPVMAPATLQPSRAQARLTGHPVDSADESLGKSGVLSEAQAASVAELVRQRFPDGRPQVERWVAEDSQGNIVNHGKYTEYDGQGAVIASGSFLFGERVGQWNKQITEEEVRELVGLTDQGFEAPFQSRANFTAGLLDGEWTVVDGKGRVVVNWAYANGVREGVSTHFSSTGEVTQSITYKNNLADGPALYADGPSVASDVHFTNGLMLRQVDRWHPLEGNKPRVLQSQEWHLVPMPLNVASSDWNSSKVEFQSTVGRPPIRHGLSTTFYASGQREFEGNYEHGKRTGTFAWWYANGQQKTVGEYRDDKEHSDWTWWHENGMKQAAGVFADGRKIDEWSQWSPSGTLVKRTSPTDAGARVAERSLEDKPVIR